MSIRSSSAPPPPASGWAALPRDVLWSIFTALGQREVLSGAGLVCAAWRDFARREPVIWRRIDLTTPEDDVVEEDGSDDDETNIIICKMEEVPSSKGSSRWKAMTLTAIDRSAGQCEAFWGRADDEVLLHLADRFFSLLNESFLFYIDNSRRASSMKSLRVTSYSYDVSSKVFAQVIKKFPLLEELELVLKPQQPSTNSWAELFQSTCEACIHLHHFKVRCARSERHHLDEERSSTTFSIPIMHGLRSLELCGGSFTKNVVMKIVDKCPSLESLNITNLPINRWDDQMRYKCYKIKDVRLPSKCYAYDSDDDMDDMS
ncbi:hypothetical protein HU200_058221 [Digitaria exilis]|uniref:F-box domain-containing protein n=1 Tax=Digitaria exilis TaxID=1010633 RepID=A0A835AIF9_9POAL|nr:hypothetical protein HU200_058221 [Digitaria exilis]